MNPKKIITFGIKGVPIVPLLLLGIVSAAGAIIATQTVTSSVTIQTNGAFTLLSFTGTAGAACSGTTTGAAFTAATYGTVSGSTASTPSSSAFCYHNTGNTPIYVGQFAPEVFFVRGSGFPTGTTEALVPFTGTLSTTANYCIPINGYTLNDAATCATAQLSASFTLQLTVPANTPAGSYTWTLTFNSYSTATG